MTKKPINAFRKKRNLFTAKRKTPEQLNHRKKSGDHTRHTQACDGQPRELSPAKHRFCPSIPEKSDLIKGKIPIQELL